MTNKIWTLTPEEDPATGDLIITFPEDLLAQAGWKAGDTLDWQDNKDGSFTLTKKDVTINRDIDIATLEEEEAWQLLEAQQKLLTIPKE
jgi:hypothetical protein